MQKRFGRRVLLLPLPLQGHLTPMFQLADILYSKGFSISIIHTHFNAPNPVDHPHFRFHPFAQGLLEGESSIADNVIALLKKINSSCVVSFRDLLSQLLSDESCVEEPVACLITDAWWFCTQAVADSLQLPRIVLRTGNLSSFLSFTSFSLLREKGYLSAQGCQLEAPVPELPPLKVKDLPVLCAGDPEVANDLICNLIEETKASKGLIFNSFEELEASSLAILCNGISIPVFTVGPFHKQVPPSSVSLLAQDVSCISWLDTQAPKSVLYVSFGSIIALDESEFVEIAWGLANSQQPFLWVIRPGVVRGSDGHMSLPNGFLKMVGDQGKIVQWAPQEEVLAHPSVGGFWTHNGWNSTLESICSGVPMICLPCFGDQMTNARYVAEVWRVGLLLEGKLTQEVIGKNIKRLMREREGIEIRRRIHCLKEKAAVCLAEGSSSYRSLESLVVHLLSF